MIPSFLLVSEFLVADPLNAVEPVDVALVLVVWVTSMLYGETRKLKALLPFLTN